MSLLRWNRSRRALASGSPEEIQQVLAALVEWLHEPEMAEFRRAFATWLREVLLPTRVPGAEIPQMADLEEVKAMLAERVKEWTREWEQEGRKKEREEVRAALVGQLEQRFGPLPEEARQRIESLDLEEILNLIAAASTAPSLSALGLG